MIALLLLLLGGEIGHADLGDMDREASKKFLYRDTEIAQRKSDYSLIVNTLLAFTIAATRKNTWEAVGGLALSHGVSYGLNKGLKLVIGRPRPDGSDKESNPSGHGAASGVNSAYVCTQDLPWACGVSAGLSITTMQGRVEGEKHTLWDVTSGFAQGALTELGVQATVGWEF